MDGKILIVDDNEDVLFALNLLLEPYVEKIKVTTSPARIEFQPGCQQWTRRLSMAGKNFTKRPASRRVVYHRIRRHRESRESYSCRRDRFYS